MHPAPPRALVERMRRDVLARVRAPHRAAFLEAHGVALDVLAATPQDDLSRVNAVCAPLASDTVDAPAALLETRATLGAVACDVASARRGQSHTESVRPADAMFSHPWLEETDGPEPREPQGLTARDSPLPLEFSMHAARTTSISRHDEPPTP